MNEITEAITKALDEEEEATFKYQKQVSVGEWEVSDCELTREDAIKLLDDTVTASQAMIHQYATEQ